MITRKDVNYQAHHLTILWTVSLYDFLKETQKLIELI